MKLATYRDGSRDGQLVVVSRDLSQACFATGIATRLQQVLDDWNFMAPQLEALSQSLNQGRARHAFNFDSRQCLPPLPRPAAWLAAEAYPAHADALRSRGLNAPERLSGPVIRMGGAETLLGANDTPDLRGLPGLEPEPQLAVIVGDVPANAVPSQALESVRLLMVVNAWVLRPVQQEEWAQGWPALHSRPASQCAPVAITPDELSGAWYLGRAALQLQMHRNGRKQPLLDAKEGMAWSFGDLVAEAARRRPLRAGTVVSAGMPGSEAVVTLKDGDSLRVDFKLADGGSPFGPIDMDLAEPAATAGAEADEDAEGNEGREGEADASAADAAEVHEGREDQAGAPAVDPATEQGDRDATS